MSDDRYDRHRYHNEDTFGIQSTAGAVPVKNKKGQISMQKVKVARYISGKRPEYAAKDGQDSSEESESDEDDFVHQQQQQRPSRRRHAAADSDSEEEEASAHRARQRLQQRHHQDEDEDDEEEAGPSSRGRRRFAEEDEEEEKERKHVPEMDLSDPRIRRLMAAKQRQADSDSEDDEGGRGDRLSRHRRIHEPEVLSDGGGEEEDDGDANRKPEAMEMTDSSSSSSGDEDMDEAAIERRRDLMRQRAAARAQIGMGQEEVMDKEEEREEASEEEDETSEEEETTDEDSEEEGARLKPVFVRKKDRLTVQEREAEEAKEREAERALEQAAKDRRKETLRLVETLVKTDTRERKTKDGDPTGLGDVVTDDENEEVEYEAWKLRELKRLKRDREEKESAEREQAELERLRGMTEEERREEAKRNPKMITNKAVKGKYKFMQKYYHRGAFYMDDEEGVYKRDYSSATLEDKFDKTVLPKVMQVKNFGRSGRTKYTHLVDQDTTQFDSPWQEESAQTSKFQMQHAGGMKPVFERPSAKKKK